jgi:hypothetical protein
MYSLIEVNPLITPPDPGPTPVYNAGFQTPQQMKMTEQVWENDKIYFLSYGNIHRACFRLLDELVRPEFKVSNVPALLEMSASCRGFFPPKTTDMPTCRRNVADTT